MVEQRSVAFTRTSLHLRTLNTEHCQPIDERHCITTDTSTVLRPTRFNVQDLAMWD
jgi:hypothetical protein